MPLNARRVCASESILSSIIMETFCVQSYHRLIRALIRFEFMFILFNFPDAAQALRGAFVLKSILGYLWDESIYVLSGNPSEY